MKKWINVKDRLPEDGKEVLTWRGFAKIDCCFSYDEKRYWENEYNKKVTHWMPLPEPPKD